MKEIERSSGIAMAEADRDEVIPGAELLRRLRDDD